MERFAPALRRVARELDLPSGVRATILLELAADLEAVYEHHRERGVGEAEAERRAEELVLGSPDLIRRLARLHAGGWRSWSGRIGERLGRGLDRLLLVFGVFPILAAAAFVGIRAAADDAAVFLWPLLGTAALLVATITRAAARLLRGEPARSHTLTTLAALSIAAPLLGLLAAAVGAYETALTLSGSTTAVSGPAATESLATPVATEIVLSAWVARDGALLLLGLLVGLSGALAWFVLLSRANRLAERDVERILASPSSVGERAPDDILPLVRGRTA